MKTEAEKVRVIINSAEYLVQKGSLISELLPEGKGVEMPCSGKGSCGKCRVSATGALSEPSEAERRMLGSEALASSVRLACQCRVLGDCRVSFARDEIRGISLAPEQAEFEKACDFTKYAAAIDVGSTTLALALYNSRGELLSTCGASNPQVQYGADVISRIERASRGEAELLALVIRQALGELIAQAASKAQIDTRDIERAVITGNTVMLSLLTKTDLSPLCKAPFKPSSLFGCEITAGDIGLEGICPHMKVFLPPCISAFVGADLVCALIYSGICRKDESALLCDIGTNGEIALWHNNTLSVCSSAAGPCFEGAGLTHGMMGKEGAIDSVSIVNSRLCAHVISQGKAKGICGAGVVDALACLLELGELDESGYLEDDVCIADSVFITRKDVRAVQLAKAAIHAAILTLITQNDLTKDDLNRYYIAGTFGSYLNLKNAERIGLLPSGASKKATVLGNAALGGASMLALSIKEREKAQVLANMAVECQLASNPIFSDFYIESMSFE